MLNTSTFIILLLQASTAVASYHSSHTTSIDTSSISTVHHILARILDWKQIKIESRDPKSKTSLPLPFISVTYAQTLDGNIALTSEKKTSSNLKLSSKESFLLTHALRSQHDGILIGGNTLSTDNPRLNNRLWSESEQNNIGEEGKMILSSTAQLRLRQPIPIILDTGLRHLMKMIESNDGIKAARSHDFIIVCCNQDAYDVYHKTTQDYCTTNDIKIELLPCAHNKSGRGLDLKDVLHQLCTKFDIQSVMVEGGASILSSFLSNHDIVDCVCITLCPRVVGGCGLNAMGSANFSSGDKHDDSCSSNLLEFDTGTTDSSWFTLGPDCIFLAPVHDK